MIVDRVKKPDLMSRVHQVAKARKASLEEGVHQVSVDSKETEAAMVFQVEMACLAFQDLRAFLARMDGLDGVEVLERMACLV